VKTVLSKWVLLSLALMSVTLTFAAGAEEHLGTSQSPLVSDVVVTVEQQEQLGLLEMNANGRGCSATLITNSWALSAAHCFDAAAMRTPVVATLDGNWGPHFQRRQADYIYRSWGMEDRGWMYDFSLIHLQTPMRVNGTTAGYVRELTELSISDMINVNVAVYGRGMNTLAFKDPKTKVDMPTTADNQFRSFVFTVNTIEDPVRFWYPKGPNGETVGGGDSGGPSFEVTRGAPRIAGVHALCHADCLAGHQCPATDSWTWVSDIKECGDAPVGNFRGAIYGLMKQAWDPTRPVQTIQMSHSEAEVQKELLLGQVDTLPWDYVRRTAQFACRNRGFDFGFFDGNYQAGVRYQARCVNASTGAWFDAGPGDMARINDKFTTLVNLGWAQGARAAGDLCKNRNAAFVAGMFTGFEAKSSNPGGFADLRDGVWCFNNSSATWFDATQGELAAQGTPIGDLNATGWAVAGRAATEYCRKKFYPAGGFFNGHQLNDKRGVVCLGPNSLVSDRVKATDDYRAARVAGAFGAAKETTVATTGGLSRGAIVAQSATLGKTPAIIAAIGAAQQPAVPTTAAPAVTTFYAVSSDGALTEYRHNNPEGGTSPNMLPPSSAAWNSYDQIIPAGGNHLYARARNGDLLWYQHDGAADGSNAWRGPNKIGNGWQSFTQILGGGNGVIYAIAPDGTLMWYRHTGFATGAATWVGPKKIGTGWNSFKTVFSAGEGVIYAVTQDGKLMVYRHLDPLGGEMRWSGPVQVGTGWNGFAQLFSTGGGVIYGLATDGKLSYYRHLTWNAATPTFKWAGPVAAGQGFNPAAKIVPLLP
jgi:Tachylectin/Trypsin